MAVGIKTFNSNSQSVGSSRLKMAVVEEDGEFDDFLPLKECSGRGHRVDTNGPRIKPSLFFNISVLKILLPEEH